MYGKLFTQMYDGTLATRGPWQALVTFQQMIILADRDGIVDMTAEAIARRTTVPLDIIQTGIDALEQPDEQSRTPDLEGRRIVRLNAGRAWGWQIVNHAHYRRIRSQEERREYMRKYQRERRAKVSVNTNVNNVSDVNQMQYAGSSMHSKTLSGRPDATAKPSAKEQSKKQHRAEAVGVLQFLNLKTGRSYKPVPANLDLIAARLGEGYGVQDCKSMIAKKVREWQSDEKMHEYLRPKTLFNRTNFANYEGELVDPEVSDGMS